MVLTAAAIRSARFGPRILAGCVGLAALAGCSAGADETPQTATDAVRDCPGRQHLKGIDVSEYQGIVDWHAVRHSGRSFAFARISDGTYHDPLFTRNWHGIYGAGMIRGAYQFIRPWDDPAMLAHIVVRAVGRLHPGDLPVAADVECMPDQGCATVPDPASYARRLRIWARAVEAGTGRAPIMYTFKSYWDVDLGGSRSFAGNPLWIASYTGHCPDIPSPWSQWTLYQYSDTGYVPGISAMEEPDHDLFNGTLEQLRVLAQMPAVVPPRVVGTGDPAPDSTTSVDAIIQTPPDGIDPNQGASPDQSTPEESGAPDDPPLPTDPSLL